MAGDIRSPLEGIDRGRRGRSFLAGCFSPSAPSFINRMRTTLRLFAVLLLLCAGAPAQGQARPGWRAELGEARSSEAMQMRRTLEQSDALQPLAQWFSYWLVMPRPVALHAVDCPTSDVRWVPEEAAVQVCYRMLVRLAGLLTAEDSTRAAWAPALYYLVLHGMAHAITDELDLPTPGGEERAVDELMALMLVPAGGARGSEILAGMRTLHRADPRWDEWDHARVHQLTPERLETVACLAHGANPPVFPEYRRSGLIPAARAGGCAAAYQRLARGLGRRLEPRMRRGGL